MSSIPYKCQSKVWTLHGTAHEGQTEWHYVELHLAASAIEQPSAVLAHSQLTAHTKLSLPG